MKRIESLLGESKALQVRSQQLRRESVQPPPALREGDEEKGSDPSGSEVPASMHGSIGKLAIRCIPPDSQYVLQFEGADWSETYPTIEAAVLRAGKLVVEETELTLYDQSGEGRVLTILFPLPLS